jgi:predicted transcriptional regulator
MDKEPGYILLRRFRETLGLTQGEMAAEAGINSAYLCQLEADVNPIGHRAAMRLWNAYRKEFRGAGITLEDLLRQPDVPTSKRRTPRKQGAAR